MEITSKERVLKNVRNALISKTDPPFKALDPEAPIYVENANPYKDIIFAEEFTKVGGKFVYSENENELIENIKALFAQFRYKNIYCQDNVIKELLTICKIPFYDEKEDLVRADVTISFCECLVARFGSVVVSSAQKTGRQGFIFAPTHIVLASTSQIVKELKEAFGYMKEKYGGKLPSMISVITGASRTADIEKTLVMGAHGPKEVFVLLTDNLNV